MSRFKRDYELIAQVGTREAITIKPDIRISFSGDKSIDGSLNKMTIKIYNLKEQNRLALTKDEDSDKLIQIGLKVGYEGSYETIFTGSVHKGSVSREGADLINTLDCIDGGFDNRFSFTSRTIRGGSVVDEVLKDTPNTRKGKISPRKNLVRPKVLVGNSFKLISEHVEDDESWFVDDGALHIIKSGQVVSGFIPVVKAKTGLKSTPTKEEKSTTFPTLMNPSIKVGGLCELVSVTDPERNGIYRVESIGYSGDYDGADWMQTVKGSLVDNFEVL